MRESVDEHQVINQRKKIKPIMLRNHLRFTYTEELFLLV